MKPEDVKPQDFYHYEGGPAMGGKPSKLIPAHEVGAIIKAAMLVQFESDTADNEHLFHEFEKERLNWLAKANELQGMK
jgi:hypothetical protein